MAEIQKEMKMFGSQISVILYDIDPVLGDVILDDLYTYGLELQKIFNLYDPGSEISRLNKLGKIKPSKHLRKVLGLALEFSGKSGGMYDISLGKSILGRKIGKEMTVSCSYRDILIDESFISLLHKDVVIDLGSIAKGYIAQQMAGKLRSEGVSAFLIDARGDLCSFGRDELISVQHPRKEDVMIAHLHIKDKAIATSGDYRQFVGDYGHSHIFNKKHIISATVIAVDLAIADLYATLLMVCDDEKIEKLMALDKGLMAMTIDEDLTMTYYNGFETLIVGGRDES